MTKPQVFKIGIPIYDQVDLMDIAAPCEMFFWMNQTWQTKTSNQKSAQVLLVSATSQAVTTAAGVAITPTVTFEACPQLDMLWVPGGYPAALKARMSDPVFLNFLRKQSQQAKFVTSVCEGAMLLASAGLLDGYQATTHWAFISCLKRFYKVEVVKGHPRFVVNHDQARDRFVVTGGGISSGLDEALKLVELMTNEMLGPGTGEAVAKGVQLTTQYFPKPPFSGKIPGSAHCPLDDVK